MSVRQDFTDYAARVESFVSFLKQLHNITLSQFQELQNIFMEWQDLISDQDIQNSNQYDISNFAAKYKATKIYEKVQMILEQQSQGQGPFYYGDIEDQLNGIKFQVSVFSWTGMSDGGSVVDIINNVFNILDSERLYLQNMGPNEQESRLMIKVDSFMATITRIKTLFQNTVNDATMMYSAILSTYEDWIVNPIIDSDFEIGVYEQWDWIKWRRTYYGEWRQNLIHQSAIDSFRMILKAVLQGDFIEKQMAEENVSFEQLTLSINDSIAEFESQIAQLQNQIQFAQEAVQTISNNTSVISMKQQQKSDKESQKVDVEGQIAQTEADIQALDPSSETYGDDLANLEQRLAKQTNRLSDLTESIAQLQSDIAQLTEQNAELEMVAGELPEKQSNLDGVQNSLYVVQTNYQRDTNLHNETIDRLGRRMQDLPLNSSPWPRGGQLFSTLISGLGVLSDRMIETAVMKTYHNSDGDLGSPLGYVDLYSNDFKFSIETPGMPELKFSFLLDRALADAINQVTGDWSKAEELYTSTDIFIPEFGWSTSIFGIFNNLFSAYATLDKKVRFKDNYSELNFTSYLNQAYRKDSLIEKLDQKKDDVDSQLAELVPQIDALSASLEASKEAIDVKISELEDVLSSIEETTGLIDKTTFLIDQKEAIKADVVAKKAKDEADLAALDPTSETYVDDAASLQAQITKAEVEIADLTSEIEALYANRSESTSTLVSLNEQQSTLQSEIDVIQESMNKDMAEKSDLQATRKELDEFVGEYDYKRNQFLESKDAVLADYQSVKDAHEQACKESESNILVLQAAIQQIAKNVKVVKSKSNIRNN